MALKTDFEATNVLSSVFIDEVANTGHSRKRRTTEKEVVAAVVKSGRKFLSEDQKNLIRRTNAQAGAEINRLKK